MTPCPLARLLLLLLSTAVLTACGTQQADSPPAADDDDPAAAPDEGHTPPLEANLTDGCVEDHVDGTDYFPDRVSFDYAEGVSVTYTDTYKVVDVATAGGETLARYVLVQCGTPAPDLTGDLAGADVIEVPAAEVVSITTTNLPHFEELDAVDRLVGVGNAGFVATPSVVEAIDAGEITEHADEADMPDLERVVATDPDLLIFDGFGDGVGDVAGRYVDAGIPTALNADFNEQTLLGRAEWLKFTGLFLNLEAQAQEAFADIESAHREVADLAADVPERPTVMVNAPFEGTWFTPGGASFLAQAIEEAGGEYVFADDDSPGSLELDFETVLDRAGDADVWLQAGSVHGTLDDLLAQDERFAEFTAFQEGEVWAHDAWLSEGGGYAVFEVAYTRADLFLSDLVAILHPELLDHEPVFFGRVPAGDDG